MDNNHVIITLSALVCGLVAAYVATTLVPKGEVSVDIGRVTIGSGSQTSTGSQYGDVAASSVGR